MESRTQGSRPRPRTQKNPRPRTAFPRTDTLEAKDRNARGQRPRTQAQVLSKKKKKGLHKNFSGDLQKKKKVSTTIFRRSQKKSKKKSKKNKVFHKNFSGDLQKKVFTKIFLAISTKKRFPKTFLSAPQTFNNSKNTAVLESRTGQFLRT